MKFTPLFTFLLFIASINSCSSKDECIIEESTSYAQNLINEVNNNQITDSIEIAENLIGDWELVAARFNGYYLNSHDCITLKIRANEIQLVDLNVGNINTFNWILESIDKNGFTGFSLRSRDENWDGRLRILNFSKELMFSSSPWDHAANLIYRKI